MRSRATAVPVSEQLSSDCVASFEYAVAMAAAFCPFRAKCLEQSLTLFYLARRAGIPVTYHHGVQPTPFEAHAWVEFQGRIINDIAEHVAFYQRFPQICP
jgi:hypothetical protein